MALINNPIPKDFDGKVALVTGAARGIGRAVSMALGRRGASILMGDILSDQGEVAARFLSGQGITTRFMKVDIRAEWDVQRFVSYAIQLYGRIDILVAAAGVMKVNPITEFTPEEYHLVFDTNVLGTALMIKHVAPRMAKNGGGSIVAISSVSADVGFPLMSLYCASKAAIGGLTRSLCGELARDKIRINALLPSLVDTDMVEEEMAAREQLGQGAGDVVLERSLASQPISRMATVDEIAEAVCFLASPTNSIMTGASLHIDGGLAAV